MKILNIAGYKFIALNDLVHLRDHLLEQCLRLSLKGTILLSAEGININVAGEEASIILFKNLLAEDIRFDDLTFHHTYSARIPFQKLKIKIKKEIITLRKPEANALNRRAPAISPAELKQWLDEEREMTLLDTRNQYEVEVGTFAKAVHLQLSDFSELPNTLAPIDKNKSIVMFCTGGIRCEKAALYMQELGYKNVYQLDGGILGYFAKVGGAHYQGECFVFDERGSVNTRLEPAVE